jgi:hypothetical protein
VPVISIPAGNVPAHKWAEDAVRAEVDEEGLSSRASEGARPINGVARLSSSVYRAKNPYGWTVERYPAA